MPAAGTAARFARLVAPGGELAAAREASTVPAARRPDDGSNLRGPVWQKAEPSGGLRSNAPAGRGFTRLPRTIRSPNDVPAPTWRLAGDATSCVSGDRAGHGAPGSSLGQSDTPARRRRAAR